MSEKISEMLSYKDFVWINRITEQVERLTCDIKESTLLNHPNQHEPFTSQTDASEKALGSVFLQNGKLIAIFSKKFSKGQKNWSIVEKELFAILKSLENYNNIVYG